MHKISHRGNLTGPDSESENSPAKILEAINLGFDIEVDIWVTSDGIYTGHDYPKYHINEILLKEIHLKSWFHAKNFEALTFLNSTTYNYFWHENDAYTLTSKDYIWTYPGKLLGDKSVLVMPEWIMDLNDIQQCSCFGVCTDFVLKI